MSGAASEPGLNRLCELIISARPINAPLQVKERKRHLHTT